MAKRSLWLVVLAAGLVGCGQEVREGRNSLTQQMMSFNKNGWSVSSGEIEQERARTAKKIDQGRIVRSSWGAGEVKFKTTFKQEANAPDSFEEELKAIEAGDPLPPKPER